jgi:hypothetical protein
MKKRNKNLKKKQKNLGKSQKKPLQLQENQ